MKPFDQMTPCAKCGADGATAEWRDAHNCGSYVCREPERIIRRCQRCGYKWCEAPLDEADR